MPPDCCAPLLFTAPPTLLPLQARCVESIIDAVILAVIFSSHFFTSCVVHHDPVDELANVALMLVK